MRKRRNFSSSQSNNNSEYIFTCVFLYLLADVPSNVVWELILGYTVDSDINYYVWIFSIGILILYFFFITKDNIAFAQNLNGLNWLATIPIPTDPFFPVTKVTGAGYAPNAIYNEFAGPIFVSRSVGETPSKGGDVTTTNISIIHVDCCVQCRFSWSSTI